ncbi:hypothetical protein [Victivallis sp. Marseille-Q1083]|uniref:hypothetical protein n=1 Tax=Victivallis sp. Marseille-Q1083 TaxID=2717288 RepID=UPI00158DCA59|nr:hypothetical protein [Victivallis sp. Marseille-Q1083]
MFLKIYAIFRLVADASKEVGKVIFLVGREIPFIYSWSCLDKDDKILMGIFFDTVDFTASISPDLFVVKKSAPQKGTVILEKALETTQKTSFIAVSRNKFWGEDVICVYSQKYSSAEDFAYKKFDIYQYDPQASQGIGKFLQSEFVNRDGIYGFNEITVVKEDYKIINWPPRGSIDPLVPIDVKEISFRGKACWELTERYPLDYPPEKYRTAQWPYTRVFIVGKENFFIYDWKYYNASKLEITHYDFSDVKFTSSFSKEWFEVPPGFKVKIASSASEAREIYISDVEAARPSWINRFSARIGSVLGNVFSWNWIFQYGAYLAISIGILCIAGIVVIKRKKR